MDHMGHVFNFYLFFAITNVHKKRDVGMKFGEI